MSNKYSSTLTITYDDAKFILYTKFVSIALITAVTLFFGLLPLFCTHCKRNSKLIGLANAFSGGLFMGISLFHLLPEASENMQKYFDSPQGNNSHFKGMPVTFFITFVSYSLILLLEKVAFDSHSLTNHTHGGHELSDIDPSSNLPEEEQVDVRKSKDNSLLNLLTPITEKTIEEDTLKERPFKDRMKEITSIPRDKSYVPEILAEHGSLSLNNRKKAVVSDIEEDNFTEEDSDEEEQTLKNVVSSKGKFASYLQARNIMKSHKQQIPDKSLFHASQILELTMSRRPQSTDNACMKFYSSKGSNKDSPLDQLDVKDQMEIFDIRDQHHHFHPTSNLTPYILLFALSIHGLFEGTALGVQNAFRETLFLLLAIIAHKWAESFALGISFSKSHTDKGSFIRMISLFAIFTPIGITIGLLLIGTSFLIQGIFLGISAGTFLYVSASEVIVEEFAITRYRYQKFIFYLCGGILVGLLSYIEAEDH